MAEISVAKANHHEGKCTFIVSNVAPNSELLVTQASHFPVSGPSGLRRRHKKSRAGCYNCKNRRVKCDESIPCANCLRRKESCQSSRQHTSKAHLPLSPAGAHNAIAATGPDATLSLKLLHHFITVTIETLPLPAEVWSHALQLTPHFDFLQDGILCIAARHLSVLQPDAVTYFTAASKYLHHTLVKFRQALSKNLATSHVDAFVSTSFLLQHEVWASGELPRISDGKLIDPLFVTSSSLKEVFLNCLCKAPKQSSLFAKHLPRDPALTLSRAPQAGVLDALDDQALFSSICSISNELPSADFALQGFEKEYHRSMEHSTMQAQKPSALVKKLSLILSFLPEVSTHPSETSHQSALRKDLSMYIFSFPVRCRNYFTGDMDPKDTRWYLLLLYHFYRAIRILLHDKQSWWAHNRVRASEALLKGKLWEIHRVYQNESISI